MTVICVKEHAPSSYNGQSYAVVNATSASVRTLTRNVIKRSEEPTAKELAPVLIYLDRITLEISLYLYS